LLGALVVIVGRQASKDDLRPPLVVLRIGRGRDADRADLILQRQVVFSAVVVGRDVGSGGFGLGVVGGVAV